MMNRRAWLAVSTILCVMAMVITPAKADVLTDNLPEVNGSSYAVMDADSGEILFGKAYDESVNPSSFVQMMTAIIIIEQGNLNDSVTVPEVPAEVNNGNKVYLRQGEKISLDKLLEAIVVYNANDAALAAAAHMGGGVEAFVTLMNEKAKEIGMSNTTFQSPFGNADSQTSTAQDIGKLAAYASNLPKYVELTMQENMDWNSDAWNKEDIPNVNGFRQTMPDATGIKIADDKSGTYDLAGSFTENGRTIIGVIMRESSTQTLYDDMEEILTHGMENTKIQNVVEKDRPMSTLVFPGNKNVRVAANASFALTTPSTTQSNVTNNAVFDQMDLPIKAGDEVGRMKIYQDEQLVQEVPLVALDAARKPMNWWTLVATILAVIYLASIAVRFYHRVLRPQGKVRPRRNGGSQGKAMLPEAPSGTVRNDRKTPRVAPSAKTKQSLAERVKKNQIRPDHRRPNDRL